MIPSSQCTYTEGNSCSNLALMEEAISCSVVKFAIASWQQEKNYFRKAATAHLAVSAYLCTADGELLHGRSHESGLDNRACGHLGMRFDNELAEHSTCSAIAIVVRRNCCWWMKLTAVSSLSVKRRRLGSPVTLFLLSLSLSLSLSLCEALTRSADFSTSFRRLFKWWCNKIQ